MEPILCGIVEASKALGIGRTKVYELIDDGKLEKIKIGRRSVITVKSIRLLASELISTS